MTGAAGTRRSVFELRQYTTVPGERDTLIDLFDSHLVTGQEAVGMHVIGQFRDLDDPDRFVWMRGFDSMPARAAALRAFYGGPVWQSHRGAANATMADSDNALLLRPIELGPAYPDFGARTELDPRVPNSVVGVTVLFNDGPLADTSITKVTKVVLPQLRAAGGVPVAVFVTDPSDNNFPALPLRQEDVLVWVTRFADDPAWAEHHQHLASSPIWQDEVIPWLAATSRPSQELRLRPTAGSQLR